MEPKRDPIWDHISPHKILDTKEQDAQWWERQREEQMRERMQPRLRLDPGNFQGPSPWARETAPPMHRKATRPLHVPGCLALPGRRVDPKTLQVIEPPRDPDPFGLLWLAVRLAEDQILSRPCDPKLKGRPERLPWIPDQSHSPLQVAWLTAEIENHCAKRGRPIQLVRVGSFEPPTPTPGELLAESMPKLPALPPWRG